MITEVKMFSSSVLSNNEGLATNKNTKRSTRTWVSVYKQWAETRNINTNMEMLNAVELDKILCRFFAEIRKQDGDDYEPDSLRVMQSSLHRYLVENDSKHNILKDIDFSRSRSILQGKARKLREEIKRPHASTFLTEKEEMLLWDAGKLGCSTPRSLVHTMWFLNTQHFGLRGNQEHITMHVGNFTLAQDDNGQEFIEFSADFTKTRQNGLHPNKRVNTPKMVATGGPRCPVILWKLYIDHRPVDMRTTGRFYLQPKMRKTIHDDVWYTRNPIGKNSISVIKKELVSGTDVKMSRKRLKNYSARKTLVKKMKSAEIPDHSVIKMIGHKNIAGLKCYDHSNEDEFKDMSNVMDVARENHPTSSSKTWPSSEIEVKCNNEDFALKADNVTNKNTKRSTRTWGECI